MKEFKIQDSHRGVKFTSLLVASTKKEAARILNKSLYEINTYALCYEPKSPECIKERGIVHAFFDSGEFFTFKHELRNKVMTRSEMVGKINEWRKIYPTYKDAENDLAPNRGF